MTLFFQIKLANGSGVQLPAGDWMAWASLVSGIAETGREPAALTEDAFLHRPALMVAALQLYSSEHAQPPGLSELVSWAATPAVAESVLAAQVQEDGAVAQSGQKALMRLKYRYASPSGKQLRRVSYWRKMYRRALHAACPSLEKKQRRRFVDQWMGDGFFENLVRQADSRRWKHSSGRFLCWGEIGPADLLGWVQLIHSGRMLAEKFNQRLFEEKMASMRRLAYGASHEINNPLANIAMRAQSLQQGEGSDRRLKSLRTIYQQSMRAHHMITDMMLFANPPKPNPEWVNVADVVAEVLAEIAAQYPQRDFRMSLVRQGQAGRWQVDRIQMAELAAALVQNSIEALAGPGDIQVTVDETPQQGFCIQVSDTGTGIAPEIQAHVFDPFFSGREAGRGLGFGLCKAWSIARQHGGDVECLSGEPGQTVFRACFRSNASEPKSQPDPAAHGITEKAGSRRKSIFAA